MTLWPAVRERTLSWIPGADAPRSELVTFALGAGAAVTVVVSAIEQLAHAVLQQRPGPTAGETLAAGVAVLLVAYVRGLDRAAIWVVAVHALSLAATFFTAVMTYAYLGRRTVGDPLAQIGPSFSSLLAGAALAVVIGAVARAAQPPPAAGRASPLLGAIGVAVIAGALVHLFWPSAFLVAASGATRPEDIRSVLLSLPDLLVGPIAGGVYAAQRGAGYLGLLGIGALLALPSGIAQAVLARGQLGIVPSPRGTVAVLFLLLALRIAAWPLAAAFVHGFLTPPAPTPTVRTDT